MYMIFLHILSYQTWKIERQFHAMKKMLNAIVYDNGCSTLRRILSLYDEKSLLQIAIFRRIRAIKDRNYSNPEWAFCYILSEWNGETLLLDALLEIRYWRATCETWSSTAVDISSFILISGARLCSHNLHRNLFNPH